MSLASVKNKHITWGNLKCPMLCNQLWQWVDAAVVAEKAGNVYAASCVCVPFDASINWQKASQDKPLRLARGVSGSVGKGYKGREIPLFQRSSA